MFIVCYSYCAALRYFKTLQAVKDLKKNNKKNKCSTAVAKVLQLYLPKTLKLLKIIIIKKKKKK